MMSINIHPRSADVVLGDVVGSNIHYVEVRRQNDYGGFTIFCPDRTTALALETVLKNIFPEPMRITLPEPEPAEDEVLF